MSRATVSVVYDMGHRNTLGGDVFCVMPYSRFCRSISRRYRTWHRHHGGKRLPKSLSDSLISLLLSQREIGHPWPM